MQSEPGDKHIISTKLHRPHFSKNHLHREDLLARFNQSRDKPLILVSAPAGYGKSTLVSSWLESCPAPSSWLSLDNNDNDLRLFVSYFISAIHKIFPGACTGTQAMLRVSHLPPFSVLATSLINELELIGKEFFLVLDEYQVIQNKIIHQLVTNFLNNPSIVMHLILISRRDPPLSLTRLRGRGHLVEIGARDLRFSLVETKELLRRTLAKPVDDTVAAVLEEKTEGWVTGLCLAILAWRNHDDLQYSLANLPVENRYAIDYIVNEILSQQPPIMLECMLKSSVLNRFCASLCDKVCCPGKGSESEGLTGSKFVETLEKDNMFVISLDEEGKWFRYHHLFQALLNRQLKKRLETEAISKLNKLASEWFDENGFVDEAIAYALESGDKKASVRLVKQHRQDIMDRTQWFHLNRWIQKFPPDFIKNDPELLLAKAWIYQREARYSKLFDTLDEIEQCLLLTESTPADSRSLYGELCSLRSFQHYATGQAGLSETNAREALESLVPQYSSTRGFAFLILSAALQLQGKLGYARNMVHEELQKDEELTPVYRNSLLTALCFTNWIATDSNNLKLAAAQLLKRGQEHNTSEIINFGSYFSGILSYQQNDLSLAEQYLLPVVSKPMVGEFTIPTIITYCQSSIALSATYLAMGREKEASETIEAATGYMLESGNSDLLEVCQAFRAELALRLANVAEADVWFENHTQKPPAPDYRFYMAHLTPSRILIARRTEESLSQTDEILTRLYDYHAKIHNTRTLIDIRALQTLLYGVQGEETKAFDSLKQGLALAEPGNFKRPFLDQGSELAGILDRLLNHDPELHFARRVAEAFASEKQDKFPRHRTSDSSHFPPPLSVEPPVDPLTNREIEVLKNLAQGMSNNEIAGVLEISPETVKRHLSNIFSKLEAKNRHQAVLSGKAIGIL